jgi:hypothetical protein
MPLVGIGTPPNPPPAGYCAPSPLFLGVGEHSLARKGLGESQFRRGTYTVVLFICTMYVLCATCSLLLLQYKDDILNLRFVIGKSGAVPEGSPGREW